MVARAGSLRVAHDARPTTVRRDDRACRTWRTPTGSHSMTSTEPSTTDTTSAAESPPAGSPETGQSSGSGLAAPPVVGPVVGVDMKRGSKWDTDSGVQPGTIEERLGGFAVKHDDGTESS